MQETEYAKNSVSTAQKPANRTRYYQLANIATCIVSSGILQHYFFLFYILTLRLKLSE